MTLEWKEAYALGHPDIDAQHQELFGLINQVAAAQTPDQLKLVLMRLYKHTREHFELEEGLILKTAVTRRLPADFGVPKAEAAW